MSAPTPTLVHYHRKARELEIGYADGSRHRLSVEYLRVFSPSAEGGLCPAWTEACHTTKQWSIPLPGTLVRGAP